MVLLNILVIIPLLSTVLASSLTHENLVYFKISLKSLALSLSAINLITSFIVWILLDNSSIYTQLMQEREKIGYFDIQLEMDPISVYFIILTTLIIPISIMSNWKSIQNKIIYFVGIVLLLEGLLLSIFLASDLLIFYIFFESILAPLFILIGIFGSAERLRASFYLFLYTFLGSLFMLLSIITMLSLVGAVDINLLSNNNFFFISQIFMFIGIIIAFAIKTPVIYLNGWLLKAHVESPLSGSIILAAIVLKLSLYGIFRLILPILPKALLYCGFAVFIIVGLTVAYASLSTIRTVDVKELIAYSSVSHAAVYLGGVISNTIQGIQGGICLALAHGFVSSGLFTSVGGILYDRSGTRLISYYRGIAQIMPIFAILFFILCLGNCGAPLTFNFIGEFMSIYGIFERLTLAGVLASSSIIFSAAFTIYMFNRIAFAGNYNSNFWDNYLLDLKFREYFILLILVLLTVVIGIYPSVILDVLQYSVTTFIYTTDYILATENIYFVDLDEKIPNNVDQQVVNNINTALSNIEQRWNTADYEETRKFGEQIGELSYKLSTLNKGEKPTEVIGNTRQMANSYHHKISPNDYAMVKQVFSEGFDRPGYGGFAKAGPLTLPEDVELKAVINGNSAFYKAFKENAELMFQLKAGKIDATQYHDQYKHR